MTDKVGGDNPRIFSYSELYIGSNGFSAKEVLGSGGFGRVYKAVLPSDNTVVAVKCLAEKGERFEKTFLAELVAVAHLRHRNLVRLRGWCVNDDQLLLVYDYMPNGNLATLLQEASHQDGHVLNWPMRHLIALGIARGLAFLHASAGLVHADVKPQNVLFDADFEAHLSDFGLDSLTVAQAPAQPSTSAAVGTLGYVSPEAILTGEATKESDVYSFGIVILEIMSGKKALDVTRPSVVLVADWAWSALRSGNVDEVFDEAIRREGPRAVMERFVRVGILCAHVMVAFRPTVSEALRMLEGDIDIPRLPERPLPLGHESFGLGRSSFGSGSGTFGSERSRPSSSASSKN